jgi:hypothetical protein
LPVDGLPERIIRDEDLRRGIRRNHDAQVFGFSRVPTYVAAQPQQTYTVSSWPGGLKDLPCSAFQKNGPDSWTVIANVYAGGMNMHNVTFGKGSESKMIEEKCATK